MICEGCGLNNPDARVWCARCSDPLPGPEALLSHPEPIMKPDPRPDPRKEGDPPFRLKTIHRNRHTKKLCKKTDPDAEAIVVAVKKVRLIEGDLYRIDEGTHVVEGRVFQIDDEGQAVPAVPIHQRAPSPAPLFE